MPYTIEVQYTHTPDTWKGYAHYGTLNEALRTFHRLEDHEAVCNIRILCDGDEVVTALPCGKEE